MSKRCSNDNHITTNDDYQLKRVKSDDNNQKHSKISAKTKHIQDEENKSTAVNEEVQNAKRTYNYRIFQDPVYGTIKLDPLLVDVIDTPQFQRLRDIKQLGASHYVFPGACHSRFEHCIGTSYLCGLMLSTLRDLHQTEYQDKVEITDKEILCVKLAGLCHDLGHGPFSHVFDGRFIPMVKSQPWSHEKASCDLLDHMIEKNPPLRKSMKERGIGEEEIELIKRMISGRSPNKDSIPETCIIDGQQLQKWYLYEIVSNKRSGIDCDKFDYFARDTLHLGMKNAFDCFRYFQNIRILPIGSQLQICVRDKEMFNMCELFHVRLALHHQVYQHKSTKVIEDLICRAFEKVNEIYDIAAAIDDMSKYTYLTDSIIYEILRSKDPAVSEAKKLLGRIHQRNLYHLCGQINPNSTKRKSDDISSAKIRDEIEGKPMKFPLDQLSEMLPKGFSEQHIRVYSTQEEKNDLVMKAFELWRKQNGYLIPDEFKEHIPGQYTSVSTAAGK